MSVIRGKSGSAWLDTEERLGAGKYGVVTVGYDISDETQRAALKRLEPQALDPENRHRVEREVAIMLRLGELRHDNIVRLLDVAGSLDDEDETAVTLVLELCAGGDLLQLLLRRGRLPEQEARQLFGQLASAIVATHHAGIIHRDLKVENIFVDAAGTLKIGDWGFACEWKRGRRLSEHCGSLPYAAPELVTGKQYDGPEVDIWALGVVLYAMLTATFPFDGVSDDKMALAISIGRFTLPPYLSVEARSLLQAMLAPDPSERPKATELLGHPWLTGRKSDSVRLTSAHFSGGGFRPTSSLPAIVEEEDDGDDHDAGWNLSTGPSVAGKEVNASINSVAAVGSDAAVVIQSWSPATSPRPPVSTTQTMQTAAAVGEPRSAPKHGVLQRVVDKLLRRGAGKSSS